MIPLSRPDIGEAEERAVLEVLRSGMLAMGRRTEELERAWSDYCGVRHAVFMSNGTVAMEALLRGLDIGPGDEVITVSFTFNATASAILRAGATPVFVDVRDPDFGMDPRQLEAAITPRTKAIMPVHLYGLMCDMDEIGRIAEQHGLLVIEDAAQAIGATFRGRRAGQFGPAMFSLYATKNVMSGEGGMATTDDEELADRLRLERNHGMRVRYHHERLGTNLKPTDLAAAVGLAQLARVEEANARRRAHARRLGEALDGLLIPVVPEGREHVWHQYTLRFPEGRDEIAEALRERGVGTLIYYPVPVHRQAYIRELLPEVDHLELPVTDRLAAEVLSVPVRANLSEDELTHVIEAITEVALTVGRPL
jgi:dTDP-4-amino-4,6-dideoxygalactose transaminase